MSRAAFESAYSAAVGAAGWVPLERWSTVRVTGGDRASFLHNMCTNDVRGLQAGVGCEAFFTDVKGKIVAHAYVLAGEAAIELVMVPDAAARLIAHLDRYIIREDVQLADATTEWAWTLVVGAKAGDAIGQLLPPPLPELTAAWSHGPLVGSLALSPRGTRRGPAGFLGVPRNDRLEVELVRCDLPWCGGFLVGCAASDAVAMRRNLIDGGARSCGDAVWHAIRVESAWPMWGVDFDDSNLPQEVGRDAAAISFRKGCYLGQETVARIDALGHVNKRIVQVRFAGDGLPAAGDELKAGEQSAGRVTSVCWSPAFQAPLGLVMVRRGFDVVGTRLQWGGGEGDVVDPDHPPANTFTHPH